MQKIIMMAGSLRKDSVNKKLIDNVAKILNKQALSFNNYECPLYNGDDEESVGIPQKAKDFVEEIINSTHMVLALPEYNGLMPGVFKNFFDWVSRAKPMPWANKKILIISASPSTMGGMRGFIHNRMPFESCGAIVYPKSFYLANAYNSFEENGDLRSEDEYKKLQSLIIEFQSF